MGEASQSCVDGRISPAGVNEIRGTPAPCTTPHAKRKRSYQQLTTSPENTAVRLKSAASVSCLRGAQGCNDLERTPKRQDSVQVLTLLGPPPDSDASYLPSSIPHTVCLPYRGCTPARVLTRLVMRSQVVDSGARLWRSSCISPYRTQVCNALQRSEKRPARPAR